MQRVRSAVAFFALFVGFSRGFSDLAKAKRLVQSIEKPRNDAIASGLAFADANGDASEISLWHQNRRRLLGYETACGFDYDSFRCKPSYQLASAFLDHSDNRVAVYVSGLITCARIEDAEGCSQKGCLWLLGSCGQTIHNFRALASDPCTKGATEIVQEIATTLECGAITDSAACDEQRTCYWSSSDECVLDRFVFHYGLPSNYLTSLSQLLVDRRERFTEFLMDIYDSEDAERSLQDILRATLPTVPCADGYQSIMCRVADALTSDIQAAVYCQLKHRSRRACIGDDLCGVSSSRDVMCTSSSTEEDKAVSRAIDILDSGISPPYMRNLAKRRTACSRTSSEEECNGDCEWGESRCTMSSSKEWEVFYEHMTYPNRHVCQYLALGTTTGCYGHSDRGQCDFDSKCDWNKQSGYCDVSTTEVVALATRPAALEDKFRDLAEQCRGSYGLEMCGSVIYDKNEVFRSEDAMAHSMLSSGILILLILSLFVAFAACIRVIYGCQRRNREQDIFGRYEDLNEGSD